MQITFNNTNLTLVEDSTHEFLLSNKEVALGYGVTTQTINDHKNKLHSDELLEGKHWMRLDVQTNGGKQSVIHWTKKGIVRLGFFIKSEQAKAFRDWAEDYIVKSPEIATVGPVQLDLITPYEVRRDLTTARRQLTLEKKKHRETAQYFEAEIKKLKELNQDEKLLEENNFLKDIFINLSDGYHKILTTCSPLDMQKELRKMTIFFKFISNAGVSLNTQTMAQLSYLTNTTK